jgi:hypothetical protein
VVDVNKNIKALSKYLAQILQSTFIKTPKYQTKKEQKSFFKS